MKGPRFFDNRPGPIRALPKSSKGPCTQPMSKFVFEWSIQALTESRKGPPSIEFGRTLANPSAYNKAARDQEMFDNRPGPIQALTTSSKGPYNKPMSKSSHHSSKHQPSINLDSHQTLGLCLEPKWHRSQHGLSCCVCLVLHVVSLLVQCLKIYRANVR